MPKGIRFDFPIDGFTRFHRVRAKSLGLLVLCLIVFWFSIHCQSPPIPFDVCPFKLITGLPCPSCGMTHSFLSMGHRDLRGAFYFNPMGPFVFAYLLLFIAMTVCDLFSGRQIYLRFWTKIKMYVLISVGILASVSWIWNFHKAGFF